MGENGNGIKSNEVLEGNQLNDQSSDRNSGSSQLRGIRAKTLKWSPPYIAPPHVDLFYVAKILEANYDSSPQGKTDEPLDRLILLLLIQRNPVKKAIKVFRQLKDIIKGDWANILNIQEERLSDLIPGLSLTELRSYNLVAIITAIINEFGSPSLGHLRKWSINRCFEFLRSLPGLDEEMARWVQVFVSGKGLFHEDHDCVRILARIGITTKVFVIKPAKAQEAQAQKIPPSLLYSLYFNLIAHGQEVCTIENPDCDKCVIRKFCGKYRDGLESKWKSSKHLPSMVDLYCGAGGTGLGLSQMEGAQEKFRIACAIDIDPWAVKSYWVNHPELPAERILQADLTTTETQQKIRRFASDENIILVIGGPPCQGVSLIGRPGRLATVEQEDTQFRDIQGHEPYDAFVRIVRAITPRFFVMENVPGLLAANGGRARREIIEDFNDVYAVKPIFVDSVNYGVPQRRLRVLIIGVLKGVKQDKAEEALKLITSSILSAKNKEVTVSQAISDLPELTAGTGHEFVKYQPHIGRPSNYQKIMHNGSIVLFNHVARPNNDRDLLLYELLQPGEIAADAIERYNRPELMIYRNDIFRDKYRKQIWNEPSTTIVAHLAKDGHMFIHPNQTRSITVREAARLQSFPDDFLFCGSRSEQFKQVGNAIPPLLGLVIREAIMKAYKRYYAEKPSKLPR